MPQREGIFINYRWVDSRYPTGVLARELKKRFGKGKVFRDVTDIRPGQRFQAKLMATLSSSRVMLAVIGDTWLSHIQSRANQANPAIDYVVLEIDNALQSGLEIIPILLDGADPPDAASLPPAIQDLASLQVIRLTDVRWDEDVSDLRAHLETQLGLTPVAPFDVRAWLRRLVRWPVLVGLGAAALLASVLAWRAYHPPVISEPPPDNLDIAFLVPPDDSPDFKDAVKVFDELQAALRLSLVKSQVRLVPENLKPGELEAFRLGKKALLSYRDDQGQVDLYIASTNSVDPSSKTRYLLLTPYLRPPKGGEAPLPVEDWQFDTVSGPTGKKDVALKAAFELIELLVANKLVHLTPAEMTRARRYLLGEYQRQLSLPPRRNCAPLAAVADELKDAKHLRELAVDATLTRAVFRTACEPLEAAPTGVDSAAVVIDRQRGSQ